ncbi:MAG: protein kinase [Polyangiaceae bacterium]|nr:protein kinase [Polyangiaceae bacterium]
MNESFRSVLAAEEELDVREDELLDEEPRDHQVSSQRSYSVPPHSAALVRARRHVRPGEVVAGKYRVERRIADVGLATLLQVRHLVLDEAATLKYLRPEALAFPDAVGDFLTGARRLSQVRSEHVARVLDVGMLDFGPPYMVTEQPTGPDLAQVIKVRGALPIPEAVDYILQACVGVAAAHDLNVIHGGLSTENIFVCRSADGSPIIRIVGFTTSSTEATDLGSAGAGMLSMASVPLSLRYLAPEHARDPGHLDVRTDVWSLGAILYELLTGQPVFEDRTVPGLLAKIVADPPTPARSLRRDIPESLERTLLRCLRKSRDDRFQTVHALKEALQERTRSSEPPAVYTRQDERDTQRPEARSWDLPEVPSARTPPPLPGASTQAPRMPPPLFVSTPPAPIATADQEPILPPSPVVSAAPPPSVAQAGSTAPVVAPAQQAPVQSLPAPAQPQVTGNRSGARTTNLLLAALAIGVLGLLAFQLFPSGAKQGAVAAKGEALGTARPVALERSPLPAPQPLVIAPQPVATAVPPAATPTTAVPTTANIATPAPPPASPAQPAASAPPAVATTVVASGPVVTASRPKKRPAEQATDAPSEAPAPTSKAATKKEAPVSATEAQSAPKKPASGTARAGLFDDQWWQ